MSYSVAYGVKIPHSTVNYNLYHSPLVEIISFAGSVNTISAIGGEHYLFLQSPP
jgi:hypothetical protein